MIMSLDNLVGISLQRIEPDISVVQRMLKSAERNIADSHVMQVSSETRFDAAYKAIMQLSNVSLYANGFRTLTSKPGHHQTMIQVLSQTIALEQGEVIVLDALRKQRNDSDYSAHIVPDSAVEACIKHAEALLLDVKHWLKEHKPELLV